jgi:hypothetical protein
MIGMTSSYKAAWNLKHHQKNPSDSWDSSHRHSDCHL